MVPTELGITLRTARCAVSAMVVMCRRSCSRPIRMWARMTASAPMPIVMDTWIHQPKVAKLSFQIADMAASTDPATPKIAVMRTVVMAQATSAATPYELLTRVSGGKVASMPASTPSTASGRSTWLSCSECLVAISCPPGAEKS